MDCWEALYMQTFHHKKTLIDEQQIGDANPSLRLQRHHTLPESNRTQSNAQHHTVHHVYLLRGKKVTQMILI